jgi:cytochrome P450
MVEITTKSLSLAALLLVIGYYVFKFIRAGKRTRAFYRGAPGLPHSAIWGSMKSMAPYMKSDRHFDYVCLDIWNDLKRPPFFYIDTWPVVRPGQVMVGDVYLAEQVNRASPEWPYSYPKDGSMGDLIAVIGPNSMLSHTGEYWKMLRRRYNPGFSSRHLQKFLPELITETKIFVSKLEDSVGKVITLGDLTTAMTVDIISTVTFGHTMHAQTSNTKLVYSFSGLLDWQKEQERQDIFHILSPIRPVMQWYYERHLNAAIDHEMQRSIREEKNLSRKSIINLTFTDEKDSNSPAFFAESRDQIKTFIFAGHDTTSTMLQWLYYDLSLHPDALSRVRDEQRSIFGPSKDSAAYHSRVEALFTSQPDTILASMPYTTAAIKETLRLHNIASGSKGVPASANLDAKDRNGKSWDLSGHTVYMPAQLYHRNEEYWGPDVQDFKPERWMEGASWKIPSIAFQPFGRGPRACIGQELVWLEAKVIVAFTIMRFEFEKVFDTKYKEAYNIRRITGKPNDGMRMRVKRVVEN